MNAQRIGYMTPDEYMPATYPAGRHCLHRRCITRLSIYNGGDYCAQHEGEHVEPDAPLPFKARIDEARDGCRVCEQCGAEKVLCGSNFKPAISNLRDGTTRVNYRRVCRACENETRKRHRAQKRKAIA